MKYLLLQTALQKKRRTVSFFFLLSLVAKNGQIINCRSVNFEISIFLNLKQDSNKVNSSLVTLSEVERLTICQTVFTAELEKHTQEPYSLFELARPLRN